MKSETRLLRGLLAPLYGGERIELAVPLPSDTDAAAEMEIDGKQEKERGGKQNRFFVQCSITSMVNITH